MRTSLLAAALGMIALIGTLSGCEKKEEEAKYARPSPGCMCSGKKDAAKCQCNHCMGEKAQGKNALCYCNQGGCDCGATMTKCPCDHCVGEEDGPACNCKAKKKK